MQRQTHSALRMPQWSTCPVSRCVLVLLVYGEVGIELLAEVVRGLRHADDWLPPTLIVKLLASRIRLKSNACGLTTSTFEFLGRQFEQDFNEGSVSSCTEDMYSQTAYQLRSHD